VSELVDVMITRRKSVALLPTGIVAASGFFQFGAPQTAVAAQSPPGPPEIVDTLQFLRPL
jgi:hypothetical protein